MKLNISSYNWGIIGFLVGLFIGQFVPNTEHIAQEKTESELRDDVDYWRRAYEFEANDARGEKVMMDETDIQNIYERK